MYALSFLSFAKNLLKLTVVYRQFFKCILVEEISPDIDVDGGTLHEVDSVSLVLVLMLRNLIMEDEDSLGERDCVRHVSQDGGKANFLSREWRAFFLCKSMM